MIGTDFPEKQTRTRRKTNYKGAAAKKTSGIVPRTDKQKEFIEFVLNKYIETGVGELEQTKLPILLSSMFQSQQDGISELGGDVSKIRNLFIEFQQHLYQTA